MVHAASALRKAGVELDGDLWLTGVIGHETPIGKKEGPKRLIQKLTSGDMTVDAIVIVEGPCAIWAASLGSTIFTVTISTDRGPIHTIKTQYCENPASPDSVASWRALQDCHSTSTSRDFASPSKQQLTTPLCRRCRRRAARRCNVLPTSSAWGLSVMPISMATMAARQRSITGRLTRRPTPTVSACRSVNSPTAPGCMH